MKETKPSAADIAGLIRRDCGPEKDVADVCVREYARTAAGVTDFGLASAAALYLALSHLGLHTRILMGHITPSSTSGARRSGASLTSPFIPPRRPRSAGGPESDRSFRR